MNYRFKKKPVVIEAFQMTRERRADNADWPCWLNMAWNEEPGCVGSVDCVDYPDSDGTDQLSIATLEGVMLVDWGDFIIRGVEGELYPCKPSIFEATYDSVEGASELKFTPGPWKVERNHHGKVFGVSGESMANDLDFVCELSESRCSSPKSVEANARLIASAPSLLEALKQCLLNIESDEFTHGRNFGAGNVARDAIEAATGVRPKEVV